MDYTKEVRVKGVAGPVRTRPDGPGWRCSLRCGSGTLLGVMGHDEAENGAGGGDEGEGQVPKDVEDGAEPRAEDEAEVHDHQAGPAEDQPASEDDLPEPQDGMTPEERTTLLCRYLAARRRVADLDFHGVQGQGLDLRGANLSGADLSRADFSGSDLRRADFSNACLEGAVLDGADLRKANFGEANVRKASLVGADLLHASLVDATAVAADLTDARFHFVALCGAEIPYDDIMKVQTVYDDGSPDLFGCRIDGSFYSKSGLTPEQLLNLQGGEAVLEDLHLFPSEVWAYLVPPAHKGLTFYFNTRLAPFDRFLVDGVIFGVLGKV